jgi:hypothetical protein
MKKENMFIIPDKDNIITRNDIKNGIVRITSRLKSYFPSEDCFITIIIKNEEFQVKLKTQLEYTDRERSYRIHLGKELMNKLDLEEYDSIIVTILGNNKYIFEKSIKELDDPETIERKKNLLELYSKFKNESKRI